MRRAAATFPRLCKPCLGITSEKGTQEITHWLYPASSVISTGVLKELYNNQNHCAIHKIDSQQEVSSFPSISPQSSHLL